MKSWFITFEGTEGSGKSTQIQRLAARLQSQGRPVEVLREPGGTAIGEEIRHTLKHSAHGHAMTPETELLLMNAARAQLVRQVIRPALAAGRVVLCDRFYDSTTAYQGSGRQMDAAAVQRVIDFAVGDTKPDLTLLLMVPLAVSEQRRRERQHGAAAIHDRFEQAGREFFGRVEAGYRALAQAEPHRVRWIDATLDVPTVEAAIWREVSTLRGAAPTGR